MPEESATSIPPSSERGPLHSEETEAWTCQAATQRKSQSLARGALREESPSRAHLSSPPTLPGPCASRPADLPQSPSASPVETRGVSGGRCRELSLVGAGSPQSLPVAGGLRRGGDSSLLSPPPALPAPLRASSRGPAPTPCAPPGSSPQHQRACLPPTPTEPCFCFISVTVFLQGASGSEACAEEPGPCLLRAGSAKTTDGLTQQRLTVPPSKMPTRAGQVTLRPLSSRVDGRALPASSRGRPSMRGCVLMPSSHQESVMWDQGHPGNPTLP